MSWRTLLLLVAMASWGCGGSDGGSADQQVDEVVSDTQVMKEATAAANRIIRNAADCQLVKEAAAEVYRELDEAAGRIQTAAGRQSLEALRRQVDRITQTCGVS